MLFDLPAGTFPTFLPIVALIDLLPFSLGRPENADSRNSYATRIATQDVSLECVLITTVGPKSPR